MGTLFRKYKQYISGNKLLKTMNYLIVSDLDGMTSKDRCELFSKELFRISRPISEPSDVTMYLFGWVNKDDSYALQVDLDYMIPVHPDHDLSTLVSLLNPAATQEEIDSISAHIGSNSSVRFGDLLPSYVQVKTKEELEADGWFPAPPELN